MKGRNVQIRNYILDLLESGTLRRGEKLPGARKIAQDLNCSFTHVQAVVESLVQCGVLRTVPRNGTYVDEEWHHRILPYNLAIYSAERIGVLNEVADKAGKKLGLRRCSQFQHGAAEIRVSHYLLSHHDEYLDLSTAFRECFGDGEEFYIHALKEFYVNGRLCGIPIVFSPRVIFYNTDLFKRFNCPAPKSDWTWEEFLDTIRRLKKHMPPHLIFNWESGIHSFNTFFLRAGCNFFDPDDKYRPRFSSDEGIRQFERYVELRELLEITGFQQNPAFLEQFCNADAAMMCSGRQLIYYLNNYHKSCNIAAVKLPSFPGGRDINLQGADLLCIRKSCTDSGIVKGLLKNILSESIQNHIASRNYAIPFRKSSAAKTLDPASGYDSALMEEIPKISASYNIFSPIIYSMIGNGCARIYTMPKEKIADEVRELGKAVEVMMKIEQFGEKHFNYYNVRTLNS
jgi:DNA-binding transcriptional regulator YhcF (GntR family)